MIKEHAAAVLALLDAVNDVPPLNWHDGVVPAQTDPSVAPYVLVRFSEAPPDLNFVGMTHVYAMRIVCHCVAGTDAAVRTVVGRVRTALQDVTPTVSGRKCYPIRWEESTDIPIHERTGTLAASMVLVYVLRSVPA
jgi:hypothetical protein